MKKLISLKNLRFAASKPAHAVSILAVRIAPNHPKTAKALFSVLQFFEQNPAERILLGGDIALIDHDLIGALNCLRMAIAVQPTVSTIYGMGARLAQSDFTDAEFEEAISKTVRDQALKTMLISLLRSPKAYHPSRFWLYFMLYNAFQIDTFGIDNFKRTANNNYFTWTSETHLDEQTRALEKIVGSESVSQIDGVKPTDFSEAKWSSYKRFLVTLYRYAKSKDRIGILNQQEEPLLGNPICLTIEGRRISQDLCHTVIELNSILPEFARATDSAFTVYELGAGHGRIGLALLKLFPNARYVVIDIPPALHVAQWYLSKTMESERVFRFRDFDTYEEIKDEFEAARIAFLLPHQASMLPRLSADLFINVCSIQEMTREHMALWFEQIERLCRGYFYTKQYLIHTNQLDGIEITRNDYPVQSDWKARFDRQCEAFPSLFEAMYSMPGSNVPLRREIV